MLHSWVWRRLSLSIDWPAFLGFSSFLVFVPWYPTKQITEEAKVCSPKVQGNKLAVLPLTALRTLNHTISWALHSRLPSVSHFPLSPPCWWEQGATQHLSTLASLSHGARSYHQNIPATPGLPMPCCPSNRYHGGWIGHSYDISNVPSVPCDIQALDKSCDRCIRSLCVKGRGAEAQQL